MKLRALVGSLLVRPVQPHVEWDNDALHGVLATNPFCPPLNKPFWFPHSSFRRSM